jgi:deaminated glutathione amidase
MRIAVLQMTSGIEPGANFETIREASHEARAQGADVLFTPEMSLLLDRDRARAARHILSQEASPYVSRLGELAEEHRLFIALGSMAVALPDGRFANRAMVFAPDLRLPAVYDKMHMFDVDLPSGESWRESSAYRPGDEVVVKDIRVERDGEDRQVFRLGLTVCYDLRFPALFQALGRRSCDIISVPAAFTVPTGEAHWHVLLRARAIEASAYVVAAAQVGQHEDGRRTYGHSLVVDPWGEVLLDMGGEGPGLGFAELQLARIAEVREQLPSLANRREIAT